MFANVGYTIRAMDNMTHPRADTAQVAPKLVSVPKAMRALGVGRNTVYKLIASGELESIQLGTRRLIPVAALDALIERLAGDRSGVEQGV